MIAARHTVRRREGCVLKWACVCRAESSWIMSQNALPAYPSSPRNRIRFVATFGSDYHLFLILSHMNLFPLVSPAPAILFFRGVLQNYLCYRTNPRDVSNVICCDPIILLPFRQFMVKREREKHLPCVRLCTRDKPTANL